MTSLSPRICSISFESFAFVLAALLLVGVVGCAGSAEAPPKMAARSPVANDRDADGIPGKEEAIPPDAVLAAQPSGAGGGTPAQAPGQAPPPAPPPPPPAPGEAPAKKAEAKPAPGATTAEGERRETQYLIYTANVTMAVYQVDQGLAQVERIAHELGGYLASKRDHEITIRVPRSSFDAALSAVDKIGDVIHRDVQAQDVTDEFVDTEIRIKNGKAMQARLRALLERAAVKEALEIEKELHRVTADLELLEGKLKLLKDKIAYSTISVAFRGRGPALHAMSIRLPFPWLTQLGLPRLLSLEEGH